MVDWISNNETPAYGTAERMKQSTPKFSLIQLIAQTVNLITQLFNTDKIQFHGYLIL